MDDYIKEVTKNAERAEHFFADYLAYTLGPVELKEKIKIKEKLHEEGELVILDVRRHDDYKKGHIEGAVSIPKEELEDRMNELSRNNLHIVYCYNAFCHLGARACLFLARNGFEAMELCGGYDTWANDFKFPVVTD